MNLEPIMPIIKSAIKRMKQTLKRKSRNQETKRNMKGAVKNFTTEPSTENLKQAQSKIDTAVKKGQLNKRTAARRKSNLVRAAKAAGVKPATTKKAATAKATVKPAAPKKAAAPSKTTTKTAPAKKAAPKAAPVKKAAPKKAVAKKPAVKKSTK